MQTTAIGTVAKSLPQNVVILLTLLIPKRYIPYTDLHKNFRKNGYDCSGAKFCAAAGLFHYCFGGGEGY